MKILIALFCLITFAQATRISEVANVVGVRDNQIIGYSLVVGLKKTGDGTTSKFTLQSIANMLKAMNIDMNPVDIKSKNVAAVVVTAKFAPFARQGDAFDVTVSSIGDAKSLEGGTLLMTPLKGVDGKIYALAQGPISIGGKNEKGAGSESHPTVGMVYGGGLVEREINQDMYHQHNATLSLKSSNFANSVAIQNAINKKYKGSIAVAIDPRTINLQLPNNKSMVEFLAEVQNIDIDYTQDQKIIINERTGTIVAGVDIEVKPVVITQGDITVKILSQDAVTKPAGSVAMDKSLVIGLNENEVYTEKGTTTVANIARSLQKLGASPKEMIAILQAMKSAGAISVDLEVI
ncbi:MAG: flagellar basal body P-ring protein FlgI [Sulfuricurvum sp.]|uniref:flagellar basal body P-ring protein FlgI n=1 Tax=Sulfuricurvum sp. TaxID=2025608 RepID=UPI00262597FD|nr:flagellar basal body P-ring protein FlgI [Sulfuricurvum sp.]MDD2837496.1 flagellar basal body P-ring protein FlgI [Sulfuricurvum sp.]MDD3596332.1 flagellar basal body P-ring protein FlgI [Sulfuricurvum sp.]MDD4883493.1 flagellar basal body P-ring protein FlgI [Sulfuricurvum sp.]